MDKPNYNVGASAKLKDIATVTSGVAFPRRMDAYSSGNIKVIQMKDLGKDGRVNTENIIRISTTEPHANQLVHKGDLIFRSRFRSKYISMPLQQLSRRGYASTAALMDEDIPNAIVAAPLLKITVSSEHVVPGYLLWWINRTESQSYFNANSVGAILRMVKKQILENLDVELPPLYIQQGIQGYLALHNKEQRILEQLTESRMKHAEKVLMLMASGTSHNRQVIYHPTIGESIRAGTFSTNPKEGNKMKRGKDQFVTPHPDGWAVKGAGNQKATKVHGTQKQATKHAEDIAKRQHSDTKIQGRDGRIRAGNSYGNDPYPPKDTK